MAENKKSLLAEFSRKAMQRLQAKKAHKKQVLHVPGLEQDITIRSLTYNEIAECNEIDDSTDRGRSDKYGVYLLSCARISASATASRSWCGLRTKTPA